MEPNTAALVVVEPEILPAIQSGRLHELEHSPAARWLERKPRSRSTYERALRRVLCTVNREILGVCVEMADVTTDDVIRFPWSSLTVPHVIAVRAALELEAGEPSYLNKLLTAWRGVLEEAEDMEILDPRELRRMLRKLKGVTARRKPCGRPLDKQALQKLFRVCETDPIPARGARDAAVVAVLFLVRRAEAAALDLADVDLETGEIRVVDGKGGKEAVVFASSGALAALRDWVEIRGLAPGPFLCRVDRAGALALERLADHSVYERCRQRGKEAGFTEGLRPHDLRRSFATALLSENADPTLVSQLMRHESIDTTMVYDYRGVEKLREVAQLFHCPYQGRKAG
jgi:integrase